MPACRGCRGDLDGDGRRHLPTATDLVYRHFARAQRDELLVSDITEHPTREGKVCAVGLDAWSRRVVGWSIDSTATAGRNVIHRDQSTQFPLLGLHPSSYRVRVASIDGSIGDCYDNAVIEAFWSRMQVELLDGRRWKTRVELATAILDDIERIYDRQRRHSALGMHTPVEFEKRTTRTHHRMTIQKRGSTICGVLRTFTGWSHQISEAVHAGGHERAVRMVF